MKYRKLLFATAILLILDSLVVISLNGGINVGTVLPGVTGILIIIRLKLGAILLGVMNKPIKGLLKVIFVIWFISFIIIEGLILTSAFSIDDNEAEYVLVLGAGLNGEELSLTLLERMKKAEEYLRKNPNTKVIVSGGQGIGEDIPEAEAMQRYLIDRGIAKDRILKEEKSTSTMENYKYSKQILDGIEGQKEHRIMVITSEFHMFRAKLLGKRNGFEVGGIPSPTPWYLLPNCCIREYFAVVKSYVFDR